MLHWKVINMIVAIGFDTCLFSDLLFIMSLNQALQVLIN